MLFNSTVFMLCFLPLAVGVYYLCARHRNGRLNVLCLASTLFYGWWDVRLVPLLVGSVTANWLLVLLFRRSRRRGLMAAGIALNLVLIAVFKYADFLAGSVLSAFGTRHESFQIVLPLAISFFTFQQISYLADLQRGARAFYSYRDYFLFVTFFPQLIAGPIVRHDEIIDQFRLDPSRPGIWERLSRGMFLFLIGVAKKVALADQAAKIADSLYARAATGDGLGIADAWSAASAFALQVYFDFSGYSDMAIGLALICGFTLPLNFNAPYRAVSIRDIWRRWHMTLTRFLRDYLYIPLGGSRARRARTAFNVLLTFVLCGLWHGAAWTYVVFGFLHGVALVVHGAWARLNRPLPKPAGWFLTMAFWLLTLVVFRAPDFDVAQQMLVSMLGFHAGAPAWQPLTWVLPVAAAVAVLGPTSQVAALERLKPSRVLGHAMALAALILLLWIGGEIPNEFIYFQF